MKFHVHFHENAALGLSPYRLLDPQGREIEWANRFLDMQAVRGLQPLSLRAYATTLLHFVRWWSTQPASKTCIVLRPNSSPKRRWWTTCAIRCNRRAYRRPPTSIFVLRCSAVFSISTSARKCRTGPFVCSRAIAAVRRSAMDVRASLSPTRCASRFRSVWSCRCRWKRLRAFGPAFEARATWPSWPSCF